MDANHEWQALADTWQRQQTPAIDLTAVAAEVRRRGRRLRLAVYGELGFTLLALAGTAWLLQQPDISGLEKAMFAVLGAVLVVYQAVVLWLRRSQLDEGGLDAAALLELEIRRSRTTLRYWRISAWTGAGLMVVLYAMVLSSLRGTPDDGHAAGMAAGLAINFVLMPLAFGYAWWRCRLTREVLRRFEALRGQLRAP